MTSRTACAVRRVLRVIELHVETAQRRKRFHLSTLHIGMTNRADLTLIVCKLLRVATGARRVTGFARQRRLRRVVLATMTEQTRQARMLRVVVLEPREVSCRREHRVRKQRVTFRRRRRWSLFVTRI